MFSSRRPLSNLLRASWWFSPGVEGWSSAPQTQPVKWCSRLSCTSPTCLSRSPQRSGRPSSVVVWCRWSSPRALWRSGLCHLDAPRQTDAEGKRRIEGKKTSSFCFNTQQHGAHTQTLYECIPACWSRHKGCRILPGNQTPPRSLLHYGSHRNTPPGWFVGRFGRCRQVSPLNSQPFWCHSSGACSSCNAVQHTCQKHFCVTTVVNMPK